MDKRDILLRIAVLLLLGVTFGIGAFVLAARSDGPRITVSNRNIDFGRVSPGGMAQRTVLIRNSGRLPLHIENIKLSCGCSRANLSEPLIPPGAESELVLAVTGSPARRETRAQVLVVSNDPKDPVVELSLRFSTLDDVWAEPASVDMGRVN